MESKKEVPEVYPATGVIFPVDEGIITDPFGSYTGVTPVPGEKVVQDADDL